MNSCPLLNKYKQELLKSRFSQSILGGLRSKNVTVSAIIGNSLLFLLPFLLASISAFVNYYSSLPFLLLNGTLGIILFILLTITKIIPVPETVKVLPDNPTYRFSLEEENEISTANDLLTWDNFKFIFPRQEHFAYRVIDPFLYALTFTLGSEISRNSYLRALISLSDTEYIFIFIFMWVSLLVGLYPLVSNAPAEVAAYQTHDAAGTNHLYRTVYHLGLTASIFVLLIIYGDISSNEPRVLNPDSSQVVLALYGILCLLPFFFSTGVLPPLLCLIEWLPETFLVLFYGGSPCTSLLRTLVQLVFSIVVTAIVHNIPHSMLWVPATFTALLSCNILAFSAAVYKSAKFWITMVFSTLISLVISLTASYYRIQMEKLDYTVIVVVVVSTVFLFLHDVYFFNIIRNPLHGMITVSKFIKLISRFLDMVVCPVVLCLYYSHLFKDGVNWSWFHTLLLCRAFREVWQRNRHCQIATLLFVLLRLSNSLSDLNYFTSLWLCSVFVHFLIRGLRRLHFCMKLQFDFIVLKKQRRKETLLITILNTVFLPVIVIVAMVTAGFNIPLLPLFTLPVFYISFPRPEKFWSDILPFSTCSDSGFYQRLLPDYLESLSNHEFRNLTFGSFLLSRTETLLIFSHVLESGFGYATVDVKGLELQETSCHTEEVNTIRDIFQSTFEERATSCINSNSTHMLQPSSSSLIQTYSDAKNVLTGVLDMPECLQKVSDNFRKCLTYFLCSKYPTCNGSLEYTASTAVGKPETAFNFTGFINRESTVEDTDGATSNEQSDDLFDNFSNSSEDNSPDSWYDKVIKFKHQEIKPDSEKPTQSPRTETAKSRYSPKTPTDTGNTRQSFRESNSGNTVPASWLKVPFSRTEVQKGEKNFSKSLLSRICSKFGYQVNEETIGGLVSSLVLALDQSDSGVCKSASQVVKSFIGNVYFGKSTSWIEENKGLKELIVKSYRFAVKLSIDETIFGDNDTDDTFLDSISKLEHDWYIGLETDPDWLSSMVASKNFLFTLGLNEEGLYTSRTLSLLKLPLFTGTVNPECVKSIWSALSFELLYLTNDDEERYSIQAHPNIMRNILTQTAAPPLGYPIFSSGVKNISILSITS